MARKGLPQGHSKCATRDESMVEQESRAEQVSGIQGQDKRNQRSVIAPEGLYEVKISSDDSGLLLDITVHPVAEKPFRFLVNVLPGKHYVDISCGDDVVCKVE